MKRALEWAAVIATGIVYGCLLAGWPFYPL